MRMRRLAGAVLCAAAALMMSGMAGPAWAGVERVGLVELMVYAGSPESGLSETAAAELADLYGEQEMALLAYHPSDDGLGTTETDARITAYGDPSLPFCVFDGGASVAHGWATVGRAYEGRLDDRLALDQLSPLDVSVNFTVAGPDTMARARVLVVDPLAAGTYEIHIAVFEDSVEHEADIYRYVVRDLLDPEALTVSAPGDSQVVERAISIAPEWQLSRLGLAAFVQDAVSMEVLQAGVWIPAPRRAPHNVSCRRAETSLMELEYIGAGVWFVTSDSTLYRNTGTEGDTLIILLDQDLPDEWRAEACNRMVCFHGDSIYLNIYEYAPGETDAYKLQVLIDSTQVTVNDSLMAEAAGSRIRMTIRSALDPTREQTVEYILATDQMPDLAFVNGGDEDGEAAFSEALDAGEHRHVVWDLLYHHSPTPSDLPDSGIVIWNGGQSGQLTYEEEADLAAFLDDGGRLYLSSQDYLGYLPPGGSTFSQDYLQISSWSADEGCATATGVEGDPIGDGLVLPLDYGSAGYDDRSDELYTGPGVFENPGGNRCGVAYHSGTPGAFATVFTAFPFEAVSPTAPDPNNQATVMDRIVGWLLSPTPTGVVEGPGGPGVGPGVWLGQNSPNPFSGGTTITYGVGSGHGAARCRVRIGVYNTQGQLVRTLVDGPQDPGRYVIAWDGRDEHGRGTASGVYLVAMSVRGTNEGESVLRRKMVHLR